MLISINEPSKSNEPNHFSVLTEFEFDWLKRKWEMRFVSSFDFCWVLTLSMNMKWMMKMKMKSLNSRPGRRGCSCSPRSGYILSWIVKYEDAEEGSFT